MNQVKAVTTATAVAMTTSERSTDAVMQETARALLAPAHPEDGEAGEQDREPAGSDTEPPTREEQEERDAGEAEADDGPRPVAALGQDLGRDRPVTALDRNHEDGREVDEDAGAAEQREDDEAEPEDGRVELEVAAEAAGDTCDQGVGRAALEALDLGRVCDVFIHASRLTRGACCVYSGSPWSDPRLYPALRGGSASARARPTG